MGAPRSSSIADFDASAYPDIVWHQVFLRCNSPASLITLSKTCRRFNSIISPSFYIEKCERDGVALPPRMWRNLAFNISNDEASTTDERETLFNYKKIYFKKPFHRNLAYTLDPSSTFHRLQIDYNLRFEHGGDGMTIEPTPLFAAEDRRINACFATSYGWCSRYMEINLEQCGIDPVIMDKIRPTITVREMNICRRDCAATYRLYAHLLKDHERFERTAVLPRMKSYSKTWAQWAGGIEWETTEHVFSEYPVGIRRVVVQTSGKDEQFWAGHYGPKFANTEVIVTFPEDVRLKDDNEFSDPALMFDETL